MKTQLIRFCVTSILGLSLTFGYAQESVNASGGNATGSGGIVSYSVGIMAYTSASSADGSVAAGVQHAFEIFSVGIEDEIHDFALKAFPNPTAGMLTLEVGNFNNTELQFQLLDLQGKRLQGDQIQSAQTELDCSHLPKGIYFLHLYDGSNSIHTFKIIKN